MNHRDLQDSAIYFWAKTAYGIAIPIIVGTGVYYSLRADLQWTNFEVSSIANNLSTHEKTTYETSKSTTDMFVRRHEKEESAISLLIAFANRVSEQLKIPFNL